MEWAELLKILGPNALPILALGYIGKWHLDRYDKEIDAKFTLAKALDALTSTIKDGLNAKH